MRAAVHIDGAEGVRPADVEDVHSLLFGLVEELHTVRRYELPRTSRSLASRVRFVALERKFTRFVQCASPRLKRNVFDLDVVG
jgi:hypothetical protein